MTLTFFATLVALGGLGGFAAGLLGVGGGALMFSLLFYVSSLLGLESLDARTVAAVAGERVYRRVSPRALRYVYAGMVGLITVRVW